MEIPQNKLIEIIREVQKRIGGRYSISTLVHYYQLYCKYKAYRKIGYGKMQSYEYTGYDAGCDTKVVRNAIKIYKELFAS